MMLREEERKSGGLATCLFISSLAAISQKLRETEIMVATEPLSFSVLKIRIDHSIINGSANRSTFQNWAQKKNETHPLVCVHIQAMLMMCVRIRII